MATLFELRSKLLHIQISVLNRTSASQRIGPVT